MSNKNIDNKDPQLESLVEGGQQAQMIESFGDGN